MDSPSDRVFALTNFEPLYVVLFVAIAIAIIVWILLWMLEAQREGAQTERECLADSDRKIANRPEPGEEKLLSNEPAEEEDGNQFQVSSQEDAGIQFSTELSSGLVKQDPRYGIIYTESPEEIDDLKEIKGVGKVLEGKLHGIGVYRFKQVAVWTDVACAEFSKLLTFKNRIYQDNWIAQAKSLHSEKYEEEL